jgi:hypothetical protein
MTSQATNCPYCNSAVAVPDGLSSGQRISCTRCGESFAYRAISVPNTAVTTAPSPGYSARKPGGLAGPSVVEAPVRPLSNRTVALLVVGVMIVMASIALLFALDTESVRREHDHHLPKSKAISIALIELVALGSYVLCLFAAWFVGWNRRERPVVEQRPWSRLSGLFGLFILLQLVALLGYMTYNARRERPVEAAPTPVKTVPPAELAALGYLPDDVDVIIGVHFAEAQDNAIGKELLGRMQTGPEELGIQDVAGWTGLKLDDIDHAVLGVRLDEGLLMGFVLVVRSRSPVDQEKVQQTLKTKPKQDLDGHTVYPYALTLKVPALKQRGFDKLPAYIWFADDHTLVVAKEFKPIPLTPRVGCEHLSRADLRTLLKERMGRTAQVWIAGHFESWDDFQGLANFAKAPELEAQLATLSKTRTLGIWLTCGEDLMLGAAFDCTDEASAKALQAKLTPTKPGEAMPLGLRADAGPLSRALIESLKTTQDGTWVQLQARASADAVRAPAK